MRATTFLLLFAIAGCETEAASTNPADDGNVVFSLFGDSLETSRPGEYSSGGGSPEKPLLVVAHAGRGAAFRAHQSGGGVAATLVGDGESDDPVLDVEGRGRARVARFAGGSVTIGADGTLVLESVARMPAADDIRLERPASVVVVAATAGPQANRLVVPAPAEGQLLWVVNDDDDPVTIDREVVGAGATRELLYAAGRFRMLAAPDVTTSSQASPP